MNNKQTHVINVLKHLWIIVELEGLLDWTHLFLVVLPVRRDVSGMLEQWICVRNYERVVVDVDGVFG